jgi:hypothetical protein
MAALAAAVRFETCTSYVIALLILDQTIKEQTSGAKARLARIRFGTTKVVPFPGLAAPS